MKKLVRLVVVLGAAAALAACSVPSLPAGVLPTNDVVPAGQGPPPHLNPMLVPFTSMVIANPIWTKEPTPVSSVQIYAPKGCNAATTNYDQASDVPDAYEVLVGCPTTSDINVLWTQINWAKMVSVGWKPTSDYGSYGTASRAFVQFYGYPNDGGNGCWAYMDLFKVNDVLGMTGYCDELTDGALPAIKTAAEQWTAAVLHQIATKQPTKLVTI